MPTTVYNSNRTGARLEDSDLLLPTRKVDFVAKGAGRALPSPQKLSSQAGIPAKPPVPDGFVVPTAENETRVRLFVTAHSLAQ